DPLKIYLPDVNWVQRKSLRVRVDEIDVVGATKRQALVSDRAHPKIDLLAPQPAPARGRPVPRLTAPPRARQLARFRVNNWIVARFALAHPRRLSIDQLRRLAPRFFRRAPESLLVFTQPSER